MASSYYDSAKASFLSQNPSIDMDTDTIKVAIGRTSAYTFSAAHQFKSSVTTVATSAALTGISVAAGVFDAADLAPAFTAVASGAALDFLVIFKDTGVAGTSPVIAYIDGISVTPNGGDINITWDNGANKIFKF